MAETRAAIADNLRAIFPHESQRALERRARVTIDAYTKDVIDFLRALKVPDEAVPSLFAHAPSDDQLYIDLQAERRGIILVSGHYGNWEMGALFLRRIVKQPVAIVAMTEANADVNRLRREIRDLLGIQTIEVGQALDTALHVRRLLAAGTIVPILMDRHVGRDRVEVEFLGRRTLFLRTPALMGFMTGAPLLPCFMERIGPGHFKVHAGTPIRVDRTRPRDEAIQAAAQEFANQFAARVRAHPEYWYHFYRYWDSQS